MKAVDYFLNGYSCSESIILEACDKGYCSRDLLSVGTAFSGGMGAGCLCGAVSGSVTVIGSLFGKDNAHGNPIIARQLANKFITKFTESHKATCCRVLSNGIEPAEKKKHCSNFVEFCSNLLEDIVKEEMIKNG